MSEDTKALNVASYTTEDGFERILVTTVLNRAMFDDFEAWRQQRQISRSEALRQMITQQLKKRS